MTFVSLLCGTSFIYLSGFGMAKEAAKQVFAASGGLTPKDVNVYDQSSPIIASHLFIFF
jgi:hypothetical protein